MYISIFFLIFHSSFFFFVGIVYDIEEGEWEIDMRGE